MIQVHPRDNRSLNQDHQNELKVPVKLKTFVELTMDVASASPRRYFFEASDIVFWNHFTSL